MANVAGRNVGTYAVNKLLRWDIVPQTGYATHQNQIGSCQAFVKGKSLYEEVWKALSFEEASTNKVLFSHLEMVLNSNAPWMNATEKFQFSFFCSREDIIFRYDADGRLANKQEILNLLQTGKVQVKQMSVSEISAVDFSNPQLQKTLSKAHLLDLLTGQFDRNPGNFIYTSSGENWDAKLIDNDLSFPKKFDSFDFKKSELEFMVYKANLPNALPRLMDREAAKAIETLDSKRLRSTLQQEAGLTDEEIEATVTRLQLLKDHIATARENISATPTLPRLVDTWDITTFEAQKDIHDNYVWMGCDRKAGIEARRDSEKPATGQNQKSS